ncbi:hypothetical protein [Arthrobacter sp. P2b]|uniref:hypothetical protein n=1 Tax=Arthrobacter sp. P2b TaxID=1938741 RepID=UPI0009A69A17|nr:hypothetical protein [Arthrobacter sp. P2b]SLJ91015.1 hypothetical protein SAMN06272721_101105 [Arthrobacter sp. P2b]
MAQRTVRAAVVEHGHQKFILATEESTAPATGQLHAVDATAAGAPIYGSGNGHRPEANYERQKI